MITSKESKIAVFQGEYLVVLVLRQLELSAAVSLLAGASSFSWRFALFRRLKLLLGIVEVQDAMYHAFVKLYVDIKSSILLASCSEDAKMRWRRESGNR